MTHFSRADFERAIGQWLSDWWDRFYARRGILPRVVEQHEEKRSWSAIDRICPAYGESFRGFRQECKKCRRK